jgi:hypothetical protein
MEYERTRPSLNPKRVWLDEKDCERLVRNEFEAVRCLIGAICYLGHVQKDLEKRGKMIPHWKQRIGMLLGGARALADDIIGTVTVTQAKQLRNTMQDMEIRMVPKASSLSTNVVIEKDLAQGLIDIAREKCVDCVEDERSCLKCDLYKILVAITPQKEYSGFQCPYSVTEWED